MQFSFEKSEAGGPGYRIMTVQIPMSPDEIRARLREIGLDPEELERDAASAAQDR